MHRNESPPVHDGLRLGLLPAALLLASAFAPPGSAQAAPVTNILEDPADDLAVVIAGTSAPAMLSGSVDAAVDLRAFAIRETRTTIAFLITVAELRSAESDPNADGSAY